MAHGGSSSSLGREWPKENTRDDPSTIPSPDGKVIWEFATARVFETVNGVTARGGSINGPGPTIAGGMLYTTSGYGTFGQMPGNVLLAFGAELIVDPLRRLLA